MRTFEEWMGDYLKFRERAGKMLSQNIPSEPGQLQQQSQELEPLRWEAEEHRAFAESYYYRAKAETADKLVQGGYPRSSAYEAAKAKSHRQLWARENTKGLCKVIDSRGMKIAQHLKLMDGR